MARKPAPPAPTRVTDLSLDQLKALAYDRVRQIERLSEELRALNTAINEREVEAIAATRLPEPTPED